MFVLAADDSQIAFGRNAQGFIDQSTNQTAFVTLDDFFVGFPTSDLANLPLYLTKHMPNADPTAR